jgi:hypothetical protein
MQIKYSITLFRKKKFPLNSIFSIPAAARSKGWDFCSPVVGNADSNPGVLWKSISFDTCVLTGMDLCVGLITRSQESNKVLCVVACKGQASTLRWTTGAVEA